MQRNDVKLVLVVVIAGAIYFGLLYLSVNYAFGAAPGLVWVKESFGRLWGSRIWSHSVHAIGVLAAAIPSALVLYVFGRPHALKLAAVTGIVTAIAVFLPSFLHPAVRPYLDSGFYLVVGIDSVKMVLILVLVTWLLNKLPSNHAMQRSARVGTPLAGTASSSDRLESASGAPTARRR